MIENLNDLRYFLEVAQTGNITRASERLGVTQPSVTIAIKRLEEKTGTVLLERSRKGAFLTRQGEAMSKLAERLLPEWEREVRAIAQGLLEPTGNYTIGVHISVAQYTLDKFLPDLLQRFPSLTFSFTHDLSRKIAEKVISRECDIGLVINPIPHPDLIMHKLLTDDVTLFKHPNFKGDVLLIDPALKQTQSLLKNLRKVFDYQREIHSSSLEVIRNLCEAKAGIAVLPTRVAEHSNVIKKVSGAPSFRDELYLVFRMERKSEASFGLLTEAIKKSLSRI